MLREAVNQVHQQYTYPRLIAGEAGQDREIAHERALALMEDKIEHNPLLLSLMKRYFTYRNPILRTMVFGIDFQNPLGVAAGFDKNARVFRTLSALGFGFVEVGSITAVPYTGNQRPRVFALPGDDALINRMGFPGDGLEVCKDRILKKLPPRAYRRYRIGTNIGASKPSFERRTEIEDIRLAQEALYGAADYEATNISSPNTEGVTGLQNPEKLHALLSATDYLHEPDSRGRLVSPHLIKLSPDLAFEQYDQVLDVILSRRHNVHGIIVTNTTTDPQIRSTLTNGYKGEPGGMSGRPLTKRALEVSRYIYVRTEGKLPITRAGGVMTPEDYWQAIAVGGASLVQVFTALVNAQTSTPNLAYKFNRDLAGRLRRAGVRGVDEARGQIKLG